MSTKGPHVIGRCWDIAHKNIRHFQTALANGTGHPKVCREMIDKWLEYRHGHGPEDEAKL
jgi:hypothetical protein